MTRQGSLRPEKVARTKRDTQSRLRLSNVPPSNEKEISHGRGAMARLLVLIPSGADALQWIKLDGSRNRDARLRDTIICLQART